MFEISDTNNNGIHIAANKRVLIVDHGLTEKSEAGCQLLNELYPLKKSIPFHVKLSYDRNCPPLCDQLDQPGIPTIIVPIPEAGRATVDVVKKIPFHFGFIVASCTVIAAQYDFDLIAFPDQYVDAKLQEYLAYAIYTSTETVKFHVPFLNAANPYLDRLWTTVLPGKISPYSDTPKVANVDSPPVEAVGVKE